MKHSISNLTATLKHLSIKLLFGTQILVISLALPSLYYMSITYDEAKQKKHYNLTNKGKKTLVSGEKANCDNTARYSSGI